jgi:hypothetical protein
VFFGRVKGCLARKRSVRADWRCSLPEEKKRVFDQAAWQWEANFAMLGVTLDDAFALRKQGKLIPAREAVSVSEDLLDPAVGALVGALLVLERRARHSDTFTVDPLNPDFFRGDTARQAATWNGLLHRVLLGHRSRFFYKVRTLLEMIENVAEEYHGVAQLIVENASTDPASHWTALDCLEFDLSTCLGEVIILLKSFLCALPGRELEAFGERLLTPEPLRTHRLHAKTSRVPT